MLLIFNSFFNFFALKVHANSSSQSGVLKGTVNQDIYLKEPEKQYKWISEKQYNQLRNQQINKVQNSKFKLNAKKHENLYNYRGHIYSSTSSRTSRSSKKNNIDMTCDEILAMVEEVESPFLKSNLKLALAIIPRDVFCDDEKAEAVGTNIEEMEKYVDRFFDAADGDTNDCDGFDDDNQLEASLKAFNFFEKYIADDSKNKN